MSKLNITLVFLFVSSIIAFGSNETNISSEKKHIVFLVSIDKNNYEADRTVPEYATMLEKDYGYETTVLIGEGPRNAYKFPNLDIILEADLLVVFSRRLALPVEQMTLIKYYLKSGKPLVGIRTANHAFHILNMEIEDGHMDWKNFVPSILGCINRGYGPVGPGIDVNVDQSSTQHPIVRDLPKTNWHTTANLYLVSPLADYDAQVLLTGQSNDLKEPIAWVRNTSDNGRVFYTSLGHPADFEMPIFIKLLTNGIKWALNEEM